MGEIEELPQALYLCYTAWKEEQAHDKSGDLTYNDRAGEGVIPGGCWGKQSSGATAGAALDALTAQLSPDETSTLVIVQSLRPDQFFTAAQQQRLEQLMARWRTARDQNTHLPVPEQAELEALIEAELHAATQRAAALPMK
jgi:hypothetical protein